MSLVCIDCDGPRSARNESGRCKTCAVRALGLSRRKPRPNCIDCGIEISRKARRCFSCSERRINTSPEVKAAREAGIRRAWLNPAHREKMRFVAIRNGKNAAKNPKHRDRLIEHGKKLEH